MPLTRTELAAFLDAKVVSDGKLIGRLLPQKSTSVNITVRFPQLINTQVQKLTRTHGWLQRKGARSVLGQSGKYEHRYFVLRGFDLCYYDKEGGTKPRGVIDLFDAELYTAENPKHPKGYMEIVESNKRNKYPLAAVDAEEFRQWLDTLSYVINFSFKAEAEAEAEAQAPVTAPVEDITNTNTNTSFAVKSARTLRASNAASRPMGTLPADPYGGGSTSFDMGLGLERAASYSSSASSDTSPRERQHQPQPVPLALGDAARRQRSSTGNESLPMSPGADSVVSSPVIVAGASAAKRTSFPLPDTDAQPPIAGSARQPRPPLPSAEWDAIYSGPADGRIRTGSSGSVSIGTMNNVTNVNDAASSSSYSNAASSNVGETSAGQSSQSLYMSSPPAGRTRGRGQGQGQGQGVAAPFTDAPTREQRLKQVYGSPPPSESPMGSPEPSARSPQSSWDARFGSATKPGGSAYSAAMESLPESERELEASSALVEPTASPTMRISHTIQATTINPASSAVTAAPAPAEPPPSPGPILLPMPPLAEIVYRSVEGPKPSTTSTTTATAADTPASVPVPTPVLMSSPSVPASGDVLSSPKMVMGSPGSDASPSAGSAPRARLRPANNGGAAALTTSTTPPTQIVATSRLSVSADAASAARSPAASRSAEPPPPRRSLVTTTMTAADGVQVSPTASAPTSTSASARKPLSAASAVYTFETTPLEQPTLAETAFDEATAEDGDAAPSVPPGLRDAIPGLLPPPPFDSLVDTYREMDEARIAAEAEAARLAMQAAALAVLGSVTDAGRENAAVRMAVEDEASVWTMLPNAHFNQATVGRATTLPEGLAGAVEDGDDEALALGEGEGEADQLAEEGEGIHEHEPHVELQIDYDRLAEALAAHASPSHSSASGTAAAPADTGATDATSGTGEATDGTAEGEGQVEGLAGVPPSVVEELLANFTSAAAERDALKESLSAALSCVLAADGRMAGQEEVHAAEVARLTKELEELNAARAKEKAEIEARAAAADAEAKLAAAAAAAAKSEAETATKAVADAAARQLAEATAKAAADAAARAVAEAVAQRAEEAARAAAEAAAKRAAEAVTAATAQAQAERLALLQHFEAVQAAAANAAAQEQASKAEAAARAELARLEAAQAEAARLEAARADVARLEAALREMEARRAEEARAAAALADAARLESAKAEAARIEATRGDQSRLEAAMADAAKLEVTRLEAVKQQTAQEAARLEAARAAEAAAQRQAAEAAAALAANAAAAAAAAEVARLAQLQAQTMPKQTPSPAKAQVAEIETQTDPLPALEPVIITVPAPVPTSAPEAASSLSTSAIMSSPPPSTTASASASSARRPSSLPLAAVSDEISPLAAACLRLAARMPSVHEEQRLPDFPACVDTYAPTLAALFYAYSDIDDAAPTAHASPATSGNISAMRMSLGNLIALCTDAGIVGEPIHDDSSSSAPLRFDAWDVQAMVAQIPGSRRAADVPGAEESFSVSFGQFVASLLMAAVALYPAADLMSLSTADRPSRLRILMERCLVPFATIQGLVDTKTATAVPASPVKTTGSLNDSISGSSIHAREKITAQSAARNQAAEQAAVARLVSPSQSYSYVRSHVRSYSNGSGNGNNGSGEPPYPGSAALPTSTTTPRRFRATHQPGIYTVDDMEAGEGDTAAQHDLLDVDTGERSSSRGRSRSRSRSRRNNSGLTLSLPAARSPSSSSSTTNRVLDVDRASTGRASSAARRRRPDDANGFFVEAGSLPLTGGTHVTITQTTTTAQSGDEQGHGQGQQGRGTARRGSSASSHSTASVVREYRYVPAFALTQRAERDAATASAAASAAAAAAAAQTSAIANGRSVSNGRFSANGGDASVTGASASVRSAVTASTGAAQFRVGARSVTQSTGQAETKAHGVARNHALQISIPMPEKSLHRAPSYRAVADPSVKIAAPTLSANIYTELAATIPLALPRRVLRAFAPSGLAYDIAELRAVLGRDLQPLHTIFKHYVDLRIANQPAHVTGATPATATAIQARGYIGLQAGMLSHAHAHAHALDERHMRAAAIGSAAFPASASFPFPQLPSSVRSAVSASSRTTHPSASIATLASARYRAGATAEYRSVMMDRNALTASDVSRFGHEFGVWPDLLPHAEFMQLLLAVLATVPSSSPSPSPKDQKELSPSELVAAFANRVASCTFAQFLEFLARVALLVYSVRAFHSGCAVCAARDASKAQGHHYRPSRAALALLQWLDAQRGGRAALMSMRAPAAAQLRFAARTGFK